MLLKPKKQLIYSQAKTLCSETHQTLPYYKRHCRNVGFVFRVAGGVNWLCFTEANICFVAVFRFGLCQLFFSFLQEFKGQFHLIIKHCPLLCSIYTIFLSSLLLRLLLLSTLFESELGSNST